MVRKKVLVTGGDGLIGRSVVQDLLECSYQVTPVDKYPTQKWSTITVDDDIRERFIKHY